MGHVRLQVFFMDFLFFFFFGCSALVEFQILHLICENYYMIGFVARRSYFQLGRYLNKKCAFLNQGLNLLLLQQHGFYLFSLIYEHSDSFYFMAYGISGNFYFMALDKVTSNVLPLTLHMNKFQTPSISCREVILKIMPCVLF